MKHKTLISLLIILATVAIDQISKLLIRQNIALNSEIDLIPNFFSLAHVRNEGVAFSFLTGVPSIFLILLALVIMAAMIAWLVTSKSPWVIIGLSIAIGGTIGNLLDRMMLGGVVDFAHFYLFNTSMPIFNMADVALDIGVFLMVIGELMELIHEK